MVNDLDTIRHKVFGLYQQRRYQEALDLSRSVEDRFPATATYWNACLLSVTGRAQEALQSLESGLERGLWWAPGLLLRDPDLAPIRAGERFERIVAASERPWRAAFGSEPQVLMLPPLSQPTGAALIALHGSPGESVETFVEHWRSVTSLGIVLVIPQSTQPDTSEGGWGWDDRTRTQRDLEIAHQRAESEFTIDPSRVVLAGFSAGGSVAISAAVGRWPFKVAGFIASAPAIDPDLVDALDQADPYLRGWITVGEKDWVRDDCVALYDGATAKGFPWHLDLVQGLGHQFPEDFASRLIDALEFILDNGA